MQEHQSKLTIKVQLSDVGLRLDKCLSTKETNIGSRSKISEWIEQGLVLVNNKKVKPSYQCCLDDEVLIIYPPKQEVGLIPWNYNLDVKFEDDHVVVINKPSGMVVHPSAGHESQTLVNALLAHTKNLSMGFNELRPGIVHRIDKETSGLLVVAKTNVAHEKLAKQFQNKTIHRVYHAIVFGENWSGKSQGKIQTYLTRHPSDRKKFASARDSRGQRIEKQTVDSELGKWAVTNYQVLEIKNKMSLVELKLETGRTHQIRIHLSEMSHPIVGDNVYGFSKKISQIENDVIQLEVKKLQRFLLHAKELGFLHPMTEQPMKFMIDWPESDLKLIRSWGFYGRTE